MAKGNYQEYQNKKVAIKQAIADRKNISMQRYEDQCKNLAIRINLGSIAEILDRDSNVLSSQPPLLRNISILN